MHIKIILLVGLMVGMVSVGFGQSTRDDAPKPPAPKYQAFKKQKKKFFLFRIFKKKQSDADEVAEFRKRVQERVEARAIEEEKASKKPQYTNPLYFGHKKPPKKRPPGKKKFCKECGLWH